MQLKKPVFKQKQGCFPESHRQFPKPALQKSLQKKNAQPDGPCIIIIVEFREFRTLLVVGRPGWDFNAPSYENGFLEFRCVDELENQSAFFFGTTDQNFGEYFSGQNIGLNNQRSCA